MARSSPRPRLLWIGQINRRGIITTRPMKIAWNNVFDSYDFVFAYPDDAPKEVEAVEARGFEDCAPTGPGVFKGKFGRTLSFVSAQREAVADWLTKAKQASLRSAAAWASLSKGGVD